MISFTAAQLDTWVSLFIFPLARILTLLSVAPVFNNAGLSGQIRLVIGLAIGLALAPALPPMPAISPGSWLGFLVLVQQMLIGAVLGFTLRITFSAVDMAGELIGLQMGLSFATFYDPQTSAQTPVISEFLGLLMLLLFLAMNGHLLTLSVLGESFKLLPISTTPFAAGGFAALLSWSATLFSAGLMLALPLIAALLIANIALGVLARVAPALNIFAVGFPVTIVSGFTVLMLAMPYFGTALERLYERGFDALAGVIRAGGGLP
ncbi:MAG: flagellar biosynthetic protein FliR [Betaproteobacteria bacterium]|nr:flagellar biosynthetic protein FliR [Betaproteobacteria bacterium]